jgi:hypothetical protein
LLGIGWLLSTDGENSGPGVRPLRAADEPARKEKTKAAEKPLAPKVELTKGWATFGLALPAGFAREGVRVGGLPTQTDVKVKWPDGSIRFALVAAQSTKAGAYAVEAKAPEKAEKGDFTLKVPNAEVLFTLDKGGSYRAVLPAKPTKDVWLSGPLVKEWRATVAPVDSDNKAHPLLRVLFDVRCYQDGKSRVDVDVENVLDVKEGNTVAYDVDVRLEGKSVFQQAKVTHYYLTRWRKVFPVGLTTAEVKPDFTPFFRAKALPRYLVLPVHELNEAKGPEFGILKTGYLEKYMPQHGGRPEIAPYPDWTARYVAHRNPTQGRFVLANGDLAGSWPVHVREPDGSLVSIDKRPGFWLDGRERQYRPDGPRGKIYDGGLAEPARPDVAHQPSLAYVPYLITGDRYYADEMKFWANYCLLSSWPGDNNAVRGGSKGYLQGNEVRGIAWALRNLADAAAYLPDSDPAKAYFTDKVINNLKLEDNYATSHVTPLGTYWEGQGPETHGTDLWTIPRLWQNNYVAWALDHAEQHGFKGGEKLRDRLVQFQLKLFTSPDFDREFATTPILRVGTKMPDGSIVYLKTLKEMAYETYGKTKDKPLAFPGYYGVDARLMLMIARREGFPGAKEAYQYLFPKIGRDPYMGGIPDLARRTGWAIAYDDEN